MKTSSSWSQPEYLENLIGRKQVDWSIFEDGTTIPVEFHNDFDIANNNKIARGEKQQIKLIYKNVEYDAILLNIDRKGIATDTYQIRYDTNNKFKEVLSTQFRSSHQFLLNDREIKSLEGKKVYSKVPGDLAEFIDFFSTNAPFKYKVEFISNPNVSAVNLFSSLGELDVEGQFSSNKTEEEFNNWLNTVAGSASLETKEGILKKRKLQQSVITKLKSKYNGFCQICGFSIIEQYGFDITEAHHIEYFSKSYNNHPSNMVILCPNHHRLVHAAHASYDSSAKTFILNNGIKLPMKINYHL